MIDKFYVQITKGMAAALVPVLSAMAVAERAASQQPRSAVFGQTCCKHFLFWCRHSGTTFRFSFVQNGDEGRLNFDHALVLLDALITARGHTKGQVRAAVRRRIVLMGEFLDIDVVTRLGAVA